MMKEVRIEIDPDGSERIDLIGFKGQGCGKVLADFAAGDKKVLEHNKPEILQQPIGQKEAQRG